MTLEAAGRAVPSAPAAAAERAPAIERPATARQRIGLPLVVLLVLLGITAVLALVSQSMFTNNENRLLKLRLREAGTVLTSGALPDIRTTLASAAELAQATNGDTSKFAGFIRPSTGSDRSDLFVTTSLWRLDSPHRPPLTVVGIKPKLVSAMFDAPAFFERAARTPTLSVIGLLAGRSRRLGYAVVSPPPGPRYVVYAERTIPPNRAAAIRRDSAFSDLDYALYLGRKPTPSDILVSSAGLPLRGRTAMITVPFGDSALTLVVRARQPLSGSLPQRLPWIIGIVGTILAIVAAFVTSRLLERRRHAEELADRLDLAASENQRLYAEQRGIAETLQHALLPEALPVLAGVETAAVYEAGEEGVDIGGDWYDLIAREDRTLLLVVGDVSGRGPRAATTMAALRHAIHAYAAQNDDPATILTKLSKLVSVADGGQLATVLCVLVDVDAHRLAVSSAGHLPPLLIEQGQSDYVTGEVGLPIGVETGTAYATTTRTVGPQAKLLAFTDGLVERRGESLDDGLARLRKHAVAAELPQDLHSLVAELHSEPTADDTAVVALRWTS